MTKQDLADACLRVVSNRCRNLRKAIDKAKTWEQAAEQGTVLNDEQLASIHSIAKKEALITELQEIIRKQTVVVQNHIGSDDEKHSEVSTRSDHTSPRANSDNQNAKESPPSAKPKPTPDASKEKSSSTPETGKVESPTSNDPKDSSSDTNGKIFNIDVTSSVSYTGREEDTKENTTTVKDQANNLTTTSTVPSSGRETKSHVDELAVKSHSKSAEMNPNTPEHGIAVPTSNHHIHQTVPSSSEVTSADGLSQGSSPVDSLSTNSVATLYTNNNQTPLLTTTSHSAHISKIVHELEEKHSKDLEQIKTACVQAVLNLFHVSDFLKQPGSRETVMNYFSTVDTRKVSRTLTDLDIDILCYFHVMLTSPNGYVPHSEAVNVSTAHCLEYLKASRSEAFKGMTYAALAEIVHAVATCPIMTDRGKETSLGTYGEDTTTLNNM